MLRSIAESSTVPEAARAMRCSLKWIYDLVRSGQMKAKKIGGRWYIPKTEIEARLRQRGH